MKGAGLHLDIGSPLQSDCSLAYLKIVLTDFFHVGLEQGRAVERDDREGRAKSCNKLVNYAGWRMVS